MLFVIPYMLDDLVPSQAFLRLYFDRGAVSQTHLQTDITHAHGQ